MPEDIVVYRKIVDGMLDKQLACGFLDGLNEIKLWSRYDLIGFYYGCKVLYGNVAEVIGEISRKDIYDNAMITGSGINHAIRHALIYNEINTDTADAMKGLYKAAFYIIQVWYLLKYGVYIAKRDEMIEKTDCAEDKLILNKYKHWNENKQKTEENPVQTLELLERWSSGMFDRLDEIHNSF
ncbi:MAG: hypothetical protein A2Y17_02305 [Clostridiales bacterium GWF2_38_85]|nr:MAG: hypothetical protein A2Y17_02305 [Clostridiales bacterium GWF2_38_85]